MDHHENDLFSDIDLEWISQKKSEVLSLLIEADIQDDIGFENYHLFEHLIPKTLEFPDEIYEFSDNRYQMKVFIATYQFEKPSFQVIYGGVLQGTNDQMIFVPIITYQTYFSEKAKILIPEKIRPINQVRN